MHILALLASFVGSAYAFADTAPLLAVPAISQEEFKYITESHNVSSALKEYTAGFCLNNDQKLVVYRVAGLKSNNFKDIVEDSTYIQHVHYKSGSELDFELSSNCKVEYLDQIPTDVNQLEANVVVVDLDDKKEHQLSDLLQHNNVVVQVKPQFTTKSSHGDSIKEFLDEKLHLNLQQLEKRDESFDDEDLDDIEDFQDLEDEYKAAEALLVANEEDVVEVSSSKKGKSKHGDKKKEQKKNSNLFTEYQFFTPGVWLSIIVSLFLVYVATTAISWITSIELSYKSFEKQVDYEKKNE